MLDELFIEDAINSGHRILLFSGYTSMFEIIQKELSERNIKYFRIGIEGVENYDNDNNYLANYYSKIYKW